MDKKFQGGIGVAVAVLLSTISADLLGYEPPAEAVAALAYVLGYVAKQAGMKVEDP